MWWRQQFKVEYSVHPSIVAAIGLHFLSLGVATMLLANPVEVAKIMNRTAIVYFGIFFSFLGTGVIMNPVTDWIEKKVKV